MVATRVPSLVNFGLQTLRTRRHKSRRTLCQGRSVRACVHSVGMLCGYMPNSSYSGRCTGLPKAHAWGLQKKQQQTYICYWILFSFSFGFSFSFVWLASLMVRTLDLQSTGRGFDSRPPHCRVATLDKSFTRAQRRWSYDRMELYKFD